MGHLNLAESAPLALAQTYLRSGASSQAEAIYRQTLAAKPDCVEAWQALGKAAWLLNRFDPCWRWLRGRDDNPWYPNLRQFRQAEAGSWDAVIDRVRAALDHETQITARQNAPLGSS